MTRRSSLSFSVVLAFLLTFVVSALSTQAAFAQGKGGAKEKPPDEVVTKGGDVRKGTITQETPKELGLDVAGKAVRIPWKDVERITYGGNPDQVCPPSVMSAESRVERNDFTGAANEGEAAVRDCESERQRKLFLPRAKLALARAKARLGQLPDAAKLAEEIVSQSPDSRYAPDAWVERIAALGAALDDSVEKAYQDGKAKADEVGEDFVLVTPQGAPALEALEIAVALYYEKKGKTLEAKTIYAKYEGSPRQNMRDRAMLGRARSMLAEGQLDAATAKLREVSQSAKDPDAIAGAFVGLGDVQVKKADAAPAKDKQALLREALTTYLQGAVLAIPSGAGSRENHENSLRQGGRCAEKILELLPQGKPESKEERARKFFTDYARKLYEELVRTYPSAKDAEDLKAKALKLKQKAT